jgi:hypothetical protein
MRALRFALIAPALILLTACNPFEVLFGTGPPPGNTPGTYAVFGVGQYYQPNLNNFITANPDDIANYFKSTMDTYHWSNTVNLRDSYVNAAAMTSAEANNDALFFAGHGDVGLMQLYFGETAGEPASQTSWGPGASDNQYPNNLSGFPVQGKLKWMFAYSSMTAAPPASLYPSRPDLTTNWAPAFGGSLHGLYGFAVHPLTNGTVTPDITLGPGQRFVQAFLSRAMAVNPYEPIHSAWINGAKDADVGELIGIWEDGANSGDVLAADSAGINFKPGGEIWYFWVDNSFEQNAFVGSPKTVGGDTFRLQPLSVNPEPLDDTTMLGNAQAQFGSADTYSNDGSVSIATKGATTISHDLRTGALTFHGTAQLNPVGFNQAQAQASAVQAVQNSNGLPSDAVLTRVDVNSKMDVNTGGTAVIGYTFTWRHANQAFGNDAIVTTVDDGQTRYRTCTGGYQIIDTPKGPRSFCMGWTTTIQDTQNISYMFRMWRSRGSARTVQSLGQTSLTASAAAASLPANTVVYDYSPGYWTGAYNDPANNVAVPAWVFSLQDGTVIYVDAYTGAVLQSIKT